MNPFRSLNFDIWIGKFETHHPTPLVRHAAKEAATHEYSTALDLDVPSDHDALRRPPTQWRSSHQQREQSGSSHEAVGQVGELRQQS